MPQEKPVCEGENYWMSEKELIEKELIREFAIEFKKFPKHGPILSSIIISSYIAQIVISVFASYNLYISKMYIPLLASLVFTGTRMRGINNIIHECSHNSFSCKSVYNKFFGKICSSILFKSFNKYRREHNSHHMHLGDLERDADFNRTKDFYFKEKI